MMSVPSWIARSAIIAFWTFLIALFLWSPALLRVVVPDQSIKLLVLPTMVDVHMLQSFEQTSGTKVHVTYYESNEELLRKLRATRAVGYDLIVASDYIVDILVKEQLLKPLAMDRVSFFNDLYPTLLNHYFDPGNRYSIPYYFGVYGLGIDTHYFTDNTVEPSWKLLFDPQGYRVTMTDDPRRAVLLAGNYLFAAVDNLNTQDHLEQIKHLLLTQKKSVELYSDIRGEETLAARSCPVALTINADLWRIRKEYTNLAFVIPHEGSFMTLDSFVISHATTQEDKVYKLLNFIYKPEVLKYHATKFGFCPPVKSVDVQGYKLICPDEQLLKKLQFFRAVISKEDIDKIWISVMAK